MRLPTNFLLAVTKHLCTNFRHGDFEADNEKKNVYLFTAFALGKYV